ncbi:MAG: phytoene/squalene synthase family protein [Acidobacteria bacterium]|nr:phytoene/squalene synthase family protein [Acidobacteriota bacterium]
MFQVVSPKQKNQKLTEIKRAYDYCESITKEHAKSFYFAAKFLPKNKQKPIYALYAFCRQIDDEVDEAEISSGKEAIKAVENWKRKLGEIFFNAKTNQLRITNYELREKSNSQLTTHNSQLILTAWQDLLKTYNIRQESALDLMKGVLQDTHINRYETFDELYIYCYRVASTVGLMSSEIFGYSDKKTLKYAESLGIAMQLTNILRDVKEDAAMNRIYLPQEDLQKFSVSEKQIFAGELNKNFVELMKFEIERARNYYAEAEKGISLLEKDTRFTILLATRLYAKILDEIKKQNYNVFTKRAHTSKRQKIFSVPKIWLEARKI